MGLENPPAQGLSADIQLRTDGRTSGKNGVVLTEVVKDHPHSTLTLILGHRLDIIGILHLKEEAASNPVWFSAVCDACLGLQAIALAADDDHVRSAVGFVTAAPAPGLLTYRFSFCSPSSCF
jgi:hypothetical protein